jgi:hypothetical protein
MLLTGALSAQPTQPQSPTPPGPHAGAAMMPMCNMADCAEKCESMSASADRALALIDESRQSDDPVKLRAALDAARIPLVTMKEHMASCKTMMHKVPASKAATPKQPPQGEHEH